MKARVALVSEARQAHGLAGGAVGGRTGALHLVLPHPEYGYRRGTAELRETYGQRVNRKVVERLHQAVGSAVAARLAAEAECDPADFYREG